MNVETNEKLKNKAEKIILKYFPKLEPLNFNNPFEKALLDIALDAMMDGQMKE